MSIYMSMSMSISMSVSMSMSVSKSVSEAMSMSMSMSIYMYSWPLNNTGLNPMGLLTYTFFSINMQSALCITGFYIPRFHQLWIKNSIFTPWLGIWGWRGLTVCTDPWHFIQGTWASMWVLEPVLCGYQGMTKVWGQSKLICGFSTVQGSVLLVPPYSRVNCVYIPAFIPVFGLI